MTHNQDVDINPCITNGFKNETIMIERVKPSNVFLTHLSQQ